MTVEEAQELSRLAGLTRIIVMHNLEELNMKIESKWKRYAVGHHLSEYLGDAAELFDALMAEEDDGKLSEVLEARGGVVWHTYENDDVVDVVASIGDMAESLQMTASGEIYEGA